FRAARARCSGTRRRRALGRRERLARGAPGSAGRFAGRYGGGAREHHEHRPVDLPVLSAADTDQETVLKADPFVQLKLLDVQELDTRIDALSHQLASIPEVVQLRELAGRRTRVDNAVRDLRIQVDDITAEQKRADADDEQGKARRARDQSMVDSGQIKDPK